MKVGDLIKPINDFKFSKGKMEIIQIIPGRILVKYHNRSTLNGEPLMSWESADEYVVDIERMREDKLKQLGL
jgi:hypothetical protein